MNTPEPGQRAPGGAPGSGYPARSRAGKGSAEPTTVRAATMADVGRVSEIEQEAFTDPWSRSAFERLVMDRDPRVLFDVACLPDGKVAGYVVAWFIMDEGEIANLAVAPASRSRGIGTLLLVTAITTARSREVGTIYLEVRDSNVAARALYASHGFQEIGRRRRYYRRPVEDALVLRLVLPGP
jgi:ribosomal-protein-alanine N-acetyltransferase